MRNKDDGPDVSSELEGSTNGCLPYDDAPQQIYLAQVPRVLFLFNLFNFINGASETVFGSVLGCIFRWCDSFLTRIIEKE